METERRRRRFAGNAAVPGGRAEAAAQTARSASDALERILVDPFSFRGAENRRIGPRGSIRSGFPIDGALGAGPLALRSGRRHLGHQGSH